MKNPNAKNVVHLFLHNNVPVHFFRKRIKFDAILEKWKTKTVYRLYLANRKSHVQNQNTELSSVYLSTINILYIFPVNALLSTPSWKNGGRKRFNAYITLKKSSPTKTPEPRHMKFEEYIPFWT